MYIYAEELSRHAGLPLVDDMKNESQRDDLLPLAHVRACLLARDYSRGVKIGIEAMRYVSVCPCVCLSVCLSCPYV